MTSGVPIEGNGSGIMLGVTVTCGMGPCPSCSCTQADICKRHFVLFSVRGLGVIPILGLPSGA